MCAGCGYDWFTSAEARDAIVGEHPKADPKHPIGAHITEYRRPNGRPVVVVTGPMLWGKLLGRT